MTFATILRHLGTGTESQRGGVGGQAAISASETGAARAWSTSPRWDVGARPGTGSTIAISEPMSNRTRSGPAPGCEPPRTQGGGMTQTALAGGRIFHGLAGRHRIRADGLNINRILTYD